MTALDTRSTLEAVREYYGKTLQTRSDLKAGACCSTNSLPGYVRPVVAMISDEILETFYGCGSPIPMELAGCTVLDLGCGSGRDVYIVSKLVGAEGRSIGVDMTEEQLAIANRHVESQMKRFGYSRPNVEFHHGYIEDLAALGIADDSIDVVISNCVINLSPDKKRVFAEIFRVLKPGGELYFSDIFACRRIPRPLAEEPVLRGECLGGAMYISDFRRLLHGLGCLDYRVSSRRRISLEDSELKAKIGHVDFDSMTIRAFKLDSLEDMCEDYGQVATYRGTLAESPHGFMLDDHHTFHTGKPMLVCGNTASMLAETRYAKHFTVTGDRSTHYGAFDCSSATRTGQQPANDTGACC